MAGILGLHTAAVKHQQVVGSWSSPNLTDYTDGEQFLPTVAKRVEYSPLGGGRDDYRLQTNARWNLGVAGISTSFLQDFYFRIHCIPQELDLGTLTNTIQREMVIWNAHLGTTANLSGIVVTNGDGIALNGPVPPSGLAPNSETLYLVSVSGDGPINVNATLEFQFSNVTAPAIVPITGTRAVLFEIIPDTPISEKWEWLTEVITSKTGTEQRIGLRSVPRRALEITIPLQTETEIRNIMSKLIFNSAGQVVIPHYQYSTLLTEATTAQSTALVFNPVRTDVRANEFAFLIQGENYELVQLSNVSALGATTLYPMTGAFPKGTVICPAYLSVIENKSNLRRLSVNSVGSITINSLSSRARAEFSRPGSAAVITTFDGYPVLDKLPTVEGNEVSDSYDTGYERIDFKTGSVEQITHWNFTKVSGSRSYLIHRTNNPQDLDYWRDFLDLVKGKLNPFLVPTFRGDEVLAVTPISGASGLELEGTNYCDNMWALLPYKRLYITSAGGNYCVEVQSVSKNAGKSICTLVSPIPSGASYTQISKISYLLKSRLESDQVSLDHGPFDTLLQLTLITIPE